MWIVKFGSIAWLTIMSASGLAGSAAGERPDVLVVHFETGSASLSADALPILDNAAAAWQQRRSFSLVVSGHSDRVGSSDLNRVLSRRRAETVRTYLQRRFVPNTFIEIEAAGETEPAVPTADGVAEPRNRRVEIRFLPRTG